MIISASRRTDIPSYYSEWFLNRIREGYVLVPNPYRPRQVSYIRLIPEVVDCIVFWSKNPQPLLAKLEQLKDFKYYFQFTLNPYDRDLEVGLPAMNQRLETFRQLADRIGKERVIWRYDPVLLNEKYNLAFHQSAFAEIASQLEGYTEKCMLGFIDHYKHVQSAVGRENIKPLAMEDIRELATGFRQSLIGSSIQLETCTTKIDLTDIGIRVGKCVDQELIERILGCSISAKKDKNQRAVCQCIESIDIGSYDSCLNGCIYCYANTARANYLRNAGLHIPTSPKLIGVPNSDEVVKVREMRSLKSSPSLF